MALVQAVENGKIVESTSSTSSKKTENSNDMGYDQFLQLLCAEMQYQDPLEPTSNTEYVAQLATFSQMEATLSMQSTIESSNANSLVGQYVIIKTTSSTGVTTSVEGFVDYVQKENGDQMVSVNGSLYNLSDVYQVADSTQVSKLPSAAQLTLSDKTDVENLTKVYQAMTSYQKSYITSDALTKYKALVAKMAELTGSDSSSDSSSTDSSTSGSSSTSDSTSD